ncbi:MAG: FAD-dependent oxidoreductase, partial [Verrucomicrobiae bacterium]|nr:FAD-dependent oxidoreductase [Verrucomicrobiae bacterium]
TADQFADATYEGDLLALAEVPYRVGREARDEYGEPHAGKVFVNIDHSPPVGVVAEGLNIRAYTSRQGTVDPTSPFSADGNSQAYNYRFCVSKDPNNRVMLTEPPAGYRREEYVDYERKGIATNAGPNLKSHMNSPILPGENQAYPEASWAEREKIIGRHKNFALGLIWFLQNDESVPEGKRQEFRQWGLAKDEFADHGHIPYEMYVREARRLVGRHVITEHDGMLAKDYRRSPLHADSVAVTDWYMDSHSCTMDSRPGFKYDGKLILTEESRPMQIPYRAMLPQGVDNLLVPVCLSSTHIAWGALRLEPVWMQTGEAAGVAAAMAKVAGVAPAELDSEVLVRELARRGHLISFFNEPKVDPAKPEVVAAQFFGTRGFFPSYDAKLDAPLAESTARVWAGALDRVDAEDYDPAETARQIAAANQAGGPPANGADFATRIGVVSGNSTLTRGQALALMWEAIQAKK